MQPPACPRGLCKTWHSRHCCPRLGCHHPGARFCLALSKARFTLTNRAFILCGTHGKPECAPSKWNTSPGILDADVNSQASASTVMSNGSYRHRLPGGKRPVREAHDVGRALLRVNPAFSAATFAAGHAFKDADKRRLFGEHLVLAGLPE
jgi:hypothetical protein